MLILRYTLIVRVLHVTGKMILTTLKVLLSCQVGFYSCDKIDVFDTDLKKESIVLFGFILFDFLKNKSDTFW